MIFEIFAAGTHTSSNGISKNFTESDLDQIANSYNPAVHESPVCIGHPEDDSPSHGWVKKLFRKGQKLFAEVENLSENLKEGLKNKYFKKRSVALYPDLKLRHLAFVPIPAVKGLNDIPDTELIKLSDTENNISNYDMDFEYEEYKSEDKNHKVQTDFESLSNVDPTVEQSNAQIGKEYFEGKFDQLEKFILTFSEKDPREIIQDAENKISNLNLNLDVAYFQQNLAEKVEHGRLTPAVKNKLLSIVEFLTTVNFSEADTNFSHILYQKFDELISDFPDMHILSEFAEKPDIESQPYEYFEFAEVDQESRTLHNKAIQLSKKENISYIAAVTKIINHN